MTWRTTLYSPFLIFFPSFFSATNTIPPPPPNLFLSQINLPLQIQPHQHLICQHSCSDSNFIEDSPLQISKTIHFLFELDFKILIFFAYFCSMYILFECILSIFSWKFIIWMYDLSMLEFVWDFKKLYLFVNWWNLTWICDLGFSLRNK